MRLKEYRRWKDDTLCARTSGQTATRLAKSRKTAKSFSITAAYVADAISCTRSTARWQAATAGIRRIELLEDSLTERWVREECPGRLLPADDLSSGHATGPRTQGKWRSAEFGTETLVGTCYSPAATARRLVRISDKIIADHSCARRRVTPFGFQVASAGWPTKSAMMREIPNAIGRKQEYDE